MKAVNVCNQDLFYFSEPDNVSYVRRSGGTTNLFPIIIMDPSRDEWRLFGDIFFRRKYLIIDGHNRAFVDSESKRKSKALKLERDEDIGDINKLVYNDYDKKHGIEHIIIRKEITTLDQLEENLINYVLGVLHDNKSLPSFERVKFHYGKRI